jgi:hypothetical protein
MTAHLGPEASAPFTEEELASLRDHGECICPVPEDVEVPSLSLPGRGPPDMRFAYKDLNGSVLGFVLRWGNGPEKEIRPSTFWRNGIGKGSWKLQTWPGKRPLFGLDRLAARPDAIVLLAEGEKAAASVDDGPLAHAFTWARYSLIGMTWPGGTNAVRYADFSPLAGRDVIILPDNDEPGEQAADELAKVLNDVGVRRLRRWKAPVQCPPKWDIADDTPDGVTADDIVTSILRAPEIAAPRIVQTLSEFLEDFTPPDYLIDGLLQKHFLYSLTGATGSGKTALTLLIASLVARRGPGRKLGSHEVNHGRVVYIAKENPIDIKMRLIAMRAKRKLDIDPTDFLLIGDIQALDKDIARIKRDVERFGPVDLVVVDTSPSLFLGDDENKNPQMLAHAKLLRRLCDELPGEPTVIANCHPTKVLSGPESLLPRGGGAFLNEMDGNLSLWGHGDRLADLHWAGKFRGPDFDKIKIKLTTVTTTGLVDRKDRLIPTVMAEIITEAEAEATEQAAEFQEDRLLVAMSKRPRSSMIDLARECGWFVSGDLQKPNKSLVNRVIGRLKRDKLVTKDGRDYVLTKPGKSAAKKASGSADKAGEEAA